MTKAFDDLVAGRNYPRLPHITCPLCGKDNTARRFDGGYGMTVSVAECGLCRLAYQTPRPTEEASLAYQNWRWSSSDDYVSDNQPRRSDAASKVKLVRNCLPGVQSILDFGAGSGVFVRSCLDAGYDAVGVETSREAAIMAKETYDVTLLDRLPEGMFDLITMWDVIEHLRDPVQMLSELALRLAPGGSLLLETSNYESWNRIAYGDLWNMYLYDHHFYFTPSSLQRTASLAGLKGFQLLNVNHARPPLRACFKRPMFFLGAVGAYVSAKRKWPHHGDIEIMIALSTKD